MYLSLAAYIASGLIVGMLMLSVKSASRSGRTVRQVILEATTFAAFGTFLVLLNVSAKQVFGAEYPQVLKGIGWLAFAPDYVRIVPFVLAAFGYVIAAVIWIGKYTWNRSAANDLSNPKVTPIKGRSLSDQLRQVNSQDEGIDIKLPHGRHWRRSEK